MIMNVDTKTNAEILQSYGLEPDPVIEAYKKDVDRTLLIENLNLSPQDRMDKFEAFMRAVQEIRGSARKRE